jgi:hypothetical protein
MCTDAQNGSADDPKQTACTLFHGRDFIDTEETRFFRGTFSIDAHHLKFLCTLHKKIQVMCIIPQHISSKDIMAKSRLKWTCDIT